MKSVMSHMFSQIPKVDMPRSVFDRSHGYKTTFNEGWLIPFYVDEALPGDTFKCKTTLFARLATPITPIMDNMFLDTFYFAVPARILWSHWKNMMGEKVNPDDTTVYVTPYISAPAGGWLDGTLYDYMGLPISITGFNVSALPFRAYNMIYNEFFRDQNQIDSVPNNQGDGPDDPDDYVLLKRGKRHDYFTSALPWPQKGAAVSLPLGTTATVWGTGKSLGLTDNHQTLGMIFDGSQNGLGVGADGYNKTVGDATNLIPATNAQHAIGVVQNEAGKVSGLYADLQGATAATINSLRQAFQLQKMLEKDARGGTRYTEVIKNHFQVDSPDMRMQRPEYLGGSSTRIIITPVQQTSASNAQPTPQGNLAAYGMVHDGNGGFTKSFTEHMIIIGLVNVRSDLTYQRGLPRMWSRSTRYDYYWPSLANLGEQEIYNREIFCDGTGADSTVWGYQERWAEYRYFPSQITGKFRSNASASLDVWHLSQDFATLPPLNQTFIEEPGEAIGTTPSYAPVSRVLAVPTQPHIIFDSFMELHCARPMPTYSVPGLIDHF